MQERHSWRGSKNKNRAANFQASYAADSTEAAARACCASSVSREPRAERIKIYLGTTQTTYTLNYSGTAINAGHMHTTSTQIQNRNATTWNIGDASGSAPHALPGEI